MASTLKQLADLVGGRIDGDPEIPIEGVAGLREAQKGQISFLANTKYLPLLQKTNASAVVVASGVETGKNKAVITVENPDLAFSKIVEHFNGVHVPIQPGVHKTAVVGAGVKFGKNVSVGAYCIVEEGAEIGDGSILHPHSYVGHFTKLGPRCILYPDVVVYHRCEVGARVILHSGVIVGADGFGYANDKGAQVKIVHTGDVLIEDDVELGAGTTVDRARFDRTIIGRGTKIDSQVVIGHNAHIGENCTIAAQVGIAGSTEIGKNVIIAGQAGISGHIRLGDNCIITGGAAVTKDVPEGAMFGGYHAIDHKTYMRQMAALRKLPSLLREVKDLKTRLEKVEGEE